MNISDIGSQTNGSYFRIGDQVQVLSSRHPDIMAGDQGKVDCSYENGYGVEVVAPYYVAGSDRGETVTEARVMWYPGKELKKI